MTSQLTDDMSGVWTVHTKTSAYRIDLHNRTASRQPVGDTADGYVAVALRKDTEVWEIVKLLNCAVGAPMAFMALGIAESPDVLTYRVTTPVVAIRQV